MLSAESLWNARCWCEQNSGWAVYDKLIVRTYFFSPILAKLCVWVEHAEAVDYAAGVLWEVSVDVLESIVTESRLTAVLCEGLKNKV